MQTQWKYAITKEELEKNINSNEKLRDKWFTSITTGDLEGIKDLIYENKNVVNYTMPTSDNTALHIICLQDNPNLELVNLLLENNPDLNIRNNFGNTSFMYACLKKHEDIVKNMISYPSLKINKKGQNSRTPLMYLLMGCSDRHIPLLHLLINNGANVNDKDWNDTSCLMYSSNFNLNIKKILIEAGSDINHKDDSGYTPLMYACDHGNIEIIRYLLEHGALINLRAENNYDVFDIIRDHKKDCEESYYNDIVGLLKKYTN